MHKKIYIIQGVLFLILYIGISENIGETVKIEQTIAVLYRSGLVSQSFSKIPYS